MAPDSGQGDPEAVDHHDCCPPVAAETHPRVAPSDEQARAQQDALDRIGRQLTDQAGKDASTATGSGNPYGVQRGGAVPVPGDDKTAR